jgi:hypothetical protein
VADIDGAFLNADARSDIQLRFKLNFAIYETASEPQIGFV